MGFDELSLKTKLSLACIVVGVILNIIGLATPSWFTGSISFNLVFFNIKTSGSTGLWRSCSRKCFGFSLVPDVDTVRAFEILGLISGLASLCPFYFFYTGNDRKAVTYSFLGSCAVAGICVLIGVIVAGSGAHDFLKISYSFVLSIISGLMYLLSGALKVYEIKEAQMTSSESSGSASETK